MNEYSFPEYDPYYQLISISKVINQLSICLDEAEKSFKNTDYLKIKHWYAGDIYASDCCELCFLNIAVSHSSIAIFVPFLEGLFRHEIFSLQNNGYIGIPDHLRTGKTNFWNIQFFYKSNGKEQKDIAKGIFQILDALNILKYFPENMEEMLKILFSYRNYCLHNGFEAKTKKRMDFKNEIQSNNWSRYFSWATTDGKPWMFSMKKEFITKCFSFCSLVKEGFEKVKGIEK